MDKEVQFHFDYLKQLKIEIGDSLIVRNEKIVGICECKGKGKGRCLGNGWAKHKNKTAELDEPSFSFNRCKYIKDFSSKDD
jgi:hypothetical protein